VIDFKNIDNGQMECVFSEDVPMHNKNWSQSIGLKVRANMQKLISHNPLISPEQK
jgi:hypothetical protein